MKKLLPLLALSCLAITSAAYAAKEKKDPMKDPMADKASGPVNLAKLFDKKLTDADGKPVDAAKLAKAKYVAVYFSAHWCPPCRKFTPELVKFTAENQKDGNFEVVFVSSDKDAKAMQAYMTETKMSWGAMLGRGADLGSVNEGINGIPHLRLFDAKGNVAVDSVDATGQYVGPNYVLRELKKLLAK